MKKRILWTFFLLILITVSYTREVFFISVNKIINGDFNFYANSIKIPFLLSYENSELIQLKYIATIFFSALFTIITITGIHFSIKNKSLTLVCIILYCLILSTSVILTFLSLIFDNFVTYYTYIRMMVGVIHNPLIYITISIAYLSKDFLEKNEKINT